MTKTDPKRASANDLGVPDGKAPSEGAPKESVRESRPAGTSGESILVALTTVASEGDAELLARVLVEERLAACVSILPVRSVYRWKDGLENEQEYMLVVKTRGGLWDALRARLHAVHPYDVPELVAVDADRVGEPYRAWLEAATVASG